MGLSQLDHKSHRDPQETGNASGTYGQFIVSGPPSLSSSPRSSSNHGSTGLAPAAGGAYWIQLVSSKTLFLHSSKVTLNVRGSRSSSACASFSALWRSGHPRRGEGARPGIQRSPDPSRKGRHRVGSGPARRHPHSRQGQRQSIPPSRRLRQRLHGSSPQSMWSRPRIMAARALPSSNRRGAWRGGRGLLASTCARF